jgi:hypothetical protein
MFLNIVISLIFTFNSNAALVVQNQIVGPQKDTLDKVSERLNNFFEDETFLKEVKLINSSIPSLARDTSVITLNTSILDENTIAEIELNLLTLNTRHIYQAEAFHAQTLCHELAHYWGFKHNNSNYYESVPVLFGDACRFWYSKKYYRSSGFSKELNLQEAQNYLLNNL